MAFSNRAIQRVTGVLILVVAHALMNAARAAASYNILLVSQNPSTGFVQGMTAAGHSVTQIAGPSSFPAILSAYQVLVLADPSAAFSAQQVSAIDAFVGSGGGLIVFEDTIYLGRLPVSAQSCPVQTWSNRKNRSGTTVVASNALTSGLAATSTLVGGSVDPVLKSGAQVALRWLPETATSPPDPPEGVEMAVVFTYNAGRVVYFNDHDAHYITANWNGDVAYGTALMRNAIDYAAGAPPQAGLKVAIVASYQSTPITNAFIDDILSMPEVDEVDLLELPNDIPADWLKSYNVVVVAGALYLIGYLGEGGDLNNQVPGHAALDAFVFNGGGLILFEEDVRAGDVPPMVRANPVATASTTTASRTGTTVLLPDHPVTRGLATTSTLNSSSFGVVTGLTYKPGAQVLMKWTSDSTPMAVAYTYGRGKIVFFNDRGAYDGLTWFAHPSYGEALMRNAVRYVAGSPCPYCESYRVLFMHHPLTEFNGVIQDIEDLGHTVHEHTNPLFPPTIPGYGADADWRTFDLAVVTWPSTDDGVDYLNQLENFVSEGGGLILFEPSCAGFSFNQPSDGGFIPITSGLNPVDAYPPGPLDNNQWRVRDGQHVTDTRHELTVGVYDPCCDFWGNPYSLNPTMNPAAHVVMRWASEANDPPEGAVLAATYSYGAGRIAYFNYDLDAITLGYWRPYDGLTLLRNSMDYVMRSGPATGCGDCDVNGVCDADEIAFSGKPDCDGNGVLDSCDLSGGTLADVDGDGVPDQCEPSELFATVIRDRAGATLLTTAGGASGQPQYTYAGSLTNFRSFTEYVYQGSQLVRLITYANDESHLQRITDVVYDPADATRVIGTLSGGCGCGGSKSNRFVYRDSRNRPIRITTAQIPATDAVTLEEFEYVDVGLFEHRRRDASGAIVVVEHRDYTANPDGSYTALVRLPVDASLAQIRSETYDAAGRLVSYCEYQELVAIDYVPGPADSCYLTEINRIRTETSGRVTYEKTETIRPSGVREVSEWSITPANLAYQPGSTKASQTYIANVANIPDQEKRNWRGENWTFNTAVGDYRLSTINEPAGLTITIAYDDASGHPERQAFITRSEPGGLSWHGPTTTLFQYDTAGRVTHETAPGPNGPVTTFFAYDGHGRRIRRIENHLGTNPAPRETLYAFNAFDEQYLVANTLAAGQGVTTYLVNESILDNDGRQLSQCAFEFTGTAAQVTALSTWNPPGPVLRQTNYEYHPLSGATTRQRVVLSDNLPFAFTLTPGSTADTVHVYDVTGVWRLTSTQPCAQTCPAGSDTVYHYDQQGRVVAVDSPVGEQGERVVTKTVFDGRGLVGQEIVTHTQELDALITSRSYTGDRQVELVAYPNATFERSEYDSFGRLWKVHRCDLSDCSGVFDLVTTHSHNYAGQRFMVDPPVSAPTFTEHDFWGRPYWFERADYTQSGEGAAARIVYNPAGLISLRADLLGNDPDYFQIDVDQITEFTYDNLGQLTQERRRHDAGEDPITDITYDVAGRRVAEVKRLGALPSAADLRTEYQYDALGRSIRSIDAAGHYVAMDYDSRGNVIRRTSYQKAAGQPPGTGGVPLRQERWKYDAAGRLAETAIMQTATALPAAVSNAAADRVRSFAYDKAGRRLAETSYNMSSGTPHSTTYLYDALGRLRRITDPVGNYEEYVYAPATGVLYEHRRSDLGNASNLRIAAYEYDALARVERETISAPNVATEIQTLEYDGEDKLLRLGRWVEAAVYTYTRQQFDSLGRRTAVIEAEGDAIARTTTTVFDRLSRPVETRIADGPQQQVTKFSYDRLDRLVKVVYPDCLDPEEWADTLNLDYDRAGRLVRRQDQRDFVVDYLHDPRGPVVQRDVSCIPYVSNNGCANFEAIRDSYAHDGLGRLTLARRQRGAVLTETSMVTRSHNDFSDLTLETQELDDSGVVKEMRYGYDQAGNRLSTLNCDTAQSPVGICLRYEYDPLNRVGIMRRNDQVLVNYSYAGHYLDLRQVATTQTNTFVEYDPLYDGHRRLQRITNRKRVNGATTGLVVHDFTYDGLGNPKLAQAAGQSLFNFDMSFGYDALQRLQATSHTGNLVGQENLTLDLVGNRSTYTDSRYGPNLTTTYGSNNAANEYASINAQSLVYDWAGNLTINERGDQLWYDFENRLINVFDQNDYDLAAYGYDALGRRVKQLRGGATTYFYYDGNRVVAEYGSTGLLRYFVDGGVHLDEHVLMNNLGTEYYYLLGSLYTVIGLADRYGNAVEAYSYDAFGAPCTHSPSPPPGGGGGCRGTIQPRVAAIPETPFVPVEPCVPQVQREQPRGIGEVPISEPEPEPLLAASVTTNNPYFFTGQRLDFNVGGCATPQLVLYHYRNRAYDALHGRFLQRDPVGYVDSMNLYEYVRGSPWRFLDPFGLACKDASLNKFLQDNGLQLNEIEKFFADRAADLAKQIQKQLDALNAKLPAGYKITSQNITVVEDRLTVTAVNASGQRLDVFVYDVRTTTVIETKTTLEVPGLLKDAVQDLKSYADAANKGFFLFNLVNYGGKVTDLCRYAKLFIDFARMAKPDQGDAGQAHSIAEFTNSIADFVGFGGPYSDAAKVISPSVGLLTERAILDNETPASRAGRQAATKLAQDIATKINAECCCNLDTGL